jgi:NAD+ diphosphatase
MTNHWLLGEPLLIDRAAHRRDTADLSAADAVVVSGSSVMASGGHVTLVAPANRPPHSVVIYLGQEAGRDLVAVLATDADRDIDPDALVGLRQHIEECAARGDAGARDRELAATAVAMTTWHFNNPRCAVCGDPTEPRKGGWTRWCERDQREHYPRTDPAVIVAITDREDRMLMAHAALFTARRYSHLAGYVEPGESLEQACHREVAEEAGLQLSNLQYVGSQPWPFPASVMVGFTATVEDETLSLDDEEISDARFVTREELGALVAEQHMLLAPPGSIARRMLESWYGGPIQD